MPTTIHELDTLDTLTAELARRARDAGVHCIARAQIRTSRRVMIRDGRRESSGVGSSSGIGLQIVTPEGGSALGSRDGLDDRATLELLDRVVEVAGRARPGRDATPMPALERLTARVVPDGLDGFDDLDLDALAERAVWLERQIAERVPDTVLRVSAGADLDAWRISREDGTDTLFAMPRCTLVMRATRGAGDSRHGVSAALPSPDPKMAWNDTTCETFLERAAAAARLAHALPDAPSHPPGSYPLVIDYALAKGLAHEAFGHASEADGFRSSVLADGGRFRRGESVGASHVSIIDEPVADDHAWQPISANGLRRLPVTIVDHGRLDGALSDPWSAGPGGVPLAGSARAESFRNAPLPRMTNIRLQVDDPLPAPGPFESYGPEEVRALLDDAGVFRRHSRVRFLSGYSGGQVNPTTGDFVFNCKAIYVLGPGSIELHRPAIFSGSMFGALRSVREAFGPLKLDALGTCGKWGQSVPSSGGSHYFLVLEPHDDVRLGGR